MPKDYLMPKLAMAMNEGTINEWLVADGSHVKSGDEIVVVETEKVSYDLQSPETGYLRILVAPGETVPVETLIGRFHEQFHEGADAGSTGDATDDTQEEVARVDSPEDEQVESGERIKATPVVRKLARELNIDLGSIQGSGPGGRIVKRDVMEAGKSPQPVDPAHAAVAVAAIAPAAVLLPTPAESDGGIAERARYSIKGTPRVAIARNMQASLQQTAQLSSTWESDMTELLRLRGSFLDRESEFGGRISINAFLIKALVYAVRGLPLANGRLIDDEIVIYDDINVGIAVAMPGQNEYDSSLIVPVLKRVQNQGVVEIDQRMKALVKAARERKLGADDMTGSTITLSSTAGVAPPGSSNTPILNPPNTVIIGPSTPVDRVVVRDGEMVVRTMLPFSMTFDHRILDGEPAARFMSKLHEAIENPGLMMA